jgi:uncharacterized membrane protein YagU involved in acid resistance
MANRSNQAPLLQEALVGAASGLFATVPMTVTMLVMQRFLPRLEQTTLEPRRVSDDMLQKMGLAHELTEEQRERISIAAHFGYGALAGMLYVPVERLLPFPRGLRGAVYGVLIWAGSYAGWLPAVRTLPPPRHRPKRRNQLMVVAHLVWGLSLDIATQAFVGQRTARRRG